MSPTTQIELVLDSDAPGDRAMSVKIALIAGVVEPTELTIAAQGAREISLSRDENGVGSLALPGSVGIVPRQVGQTDSVTAWIRASLPARGAAPSIELDRVVSFPFVRGQRGTVRVFLALRCADRATECTSVTDEQCTVSVRCREQGATCGDLGECVQVAVAVRPPDAGASFDAASRTVDVTTGRINSDVPRDTLRDVGSDRPTDAPVDVPSDMLTDIPILQDVPTPVSPPRLMAPMSGASTTTRRPTLAAQPAPGFTRVDYELCTTRSCAVIEQHLFAGPTARPVSALTPGWHWWRARTMFANMPVGPYSPTSQFYVPLLDSPVDSSYGGALDLDGDGLVDLALGATQSIPGTRNGSGPGYVLIKWGGRMGPTAGPTLNGDAIGDQFGYALSAGDVNCDGLPDLIVGAPQPMIAGDGGVAGTGYVKIFLGTTVRANFGTPPLVWTLQGTQPGAQFGFSVAGVGDFEVDGCADYAVGSPYEDSNGQLDNGAVRLFAGGMPGNMRERAIGRVSTDLLGYSLSNAGDFDGDRVADFVAGAPTTDMGANVDVGAFVMYFGGVAPFAELRSVGTVAVSQLGNAVAGSGDINGDGYTDIAIAAQIFAMGNGRVTVYAGNAARTIGAPLRTLTGTNEEFGHSVAFIGPSFATQRDSLIVGAPYSDLAGSSQGRFYYYSGPVVGSMTLWVHSGSHLSGIVNSNFGWSVANAGDVNGDGISDWIVGANRSDPMADQYLGRAALYLGTGLNGALSVPINYYGRTRNDQLGASVQ